MFMFINPVDHNTIEKERWMHREIVLGRTLECDRQTEAFSWNGVPVGVGIPSVCCDVLAASPGC